MFERIFGQTSLNVLEKALQGSSLRHQVISNNLSNVNTPGFKRSEVSFEEQLATASQNLNSTGISRTHEKHLAHSSLSTTPRIVNITNTSLRTDGNNVDVDAEMASMTKNNIFYNAVAQKISGYFSNLKTAINEGRR